MSRTFASRLVLVAFLLTAPFAVHAVLAKPDRDPVPIRDWPMFGGGPSRNMVNLADKKLAVIWSVEDGKHINIQWVAEIGNRTFGSPIVANGKVFIGSGRKGLGGPLADKSILSAFRETDGKLLWQISHENSPKHHPLHASIEGLFSNPTIDANKVYYVTPLNEVICADCTDGKILWRFDMVKELKVVQLDQIVCPAFQFNGSVCSPLVVGDFVYVVTSNSADENRKVANLNAPSFVALHKKTGRLAWSSNLPGDKIIQTNWSSAAFAVVNREPQVIFAGGDGVVYGFVPDTGKLIWKCDCLPFRGQAKNGEPDQHFVGTPVVVGDRLYIGLGELPEQPNNARRSSYFLCLDISKRGDVSLKSYDKDAKANKDSALVWAFGGRIEPAPKRGPDVYFHGTAGAAAVNDGLVYVADCNGYLLCLDQRTGVMQWRYDVKSTIWGSPYVVDNRVFLATADGEIHLFAHRRAARHLATIDMGDQVTTTPTAANGVIYVATCTKLYAIANR